MCANVGVMDEAWRQVTADIAELATRAVYALSDTELCETAAVVHAISSRCVAVLAALAHEAHGRDLPHRQAATSTVAWLRDLLRISPAEARALVSLGEVLDTRPVLADAVTDGAVNTSQAAAIGRVLTDAPDTEPPRLLDKVETVLIGHAAQFEPTILRRLGERVIAHINPDLADTRLRDRLEREHKHAQQHRGFTLTPDGLGGIRLSGVVDVEGAAIIDAALQPLTRPNRGADGPDPRTPTARRADALIDVCRIALAAGGLPDNGGTPPQLNVTVDFDALARDLAVGQLDTGAQLSPSATRRLACQAQILPVILDGHSVPIDLGRARRPFTGATRTAVILRDRGCAVPGCDRPSRWCHIHHIQFWAHGRHTNRDNGVALCRHHHQLIHTTDWTIQLAPDHKPDFLPPRHIDPTQRPRRNPYHQRRQQSAIDESDPPIVQAAAAPRTLTIAHRDRPTRQHTHGSPTAPPATSASVRSGQAPFRIAPTGDGRSRCAARNIGGSQPNAPSRPPTSAKSAGSPPAARPAKADQPRRRQAVPNHPAVPRATEARSPADHPAHPATRTQSPQIILGPDQA